MRSSEEQVQFCFDITRAARKLGIGLRKQGRRFGFFDPACTRIVNGQELDDPKAALESACEALVRHFCVTTQ